MSAGLGNVGFRLSRQNLFFVAFYLCLTGLYSQFHLYYGGKIIIPFPVPNIIGVICFFALSRKEYSLIAFYTFLSLGLFTSIFLLISIDEGYWRSAIPKHLQLMLSIFSSFGICLMITQMSKSRLRIHLKRLSISILIVAIAEVHLGLYAIMIDINEFLYSWRPQGFYEGVNRDIRLWGNIRPLVFSTEPSLVGVWGSVLMIGATILAPDQGARRYIKLVAYVGILLLVSRSTTSLLILAFFVFAKAFESNNTTSNRLWMLASIALVGVVLTLTSISTTLGQYALGTSFFARILGPYLTTIEVLSIHPMLGLGLGNETDLVGIVIEVWHETGMLSKSSEYVEIAGINGMLTNNFFWNWINFGIFGGTTLVLIVFFLVRRVGKFSLLVAALSTVGVWMTIGGFVDLRTWFFPFFFVACLISREKGETSVKK